ncbi:hypothetical protein V495_06118 [Pseudogymnoascus sp. VKM F-4514 (FW-929)]|nr:hypothetical protein V495_06118 [Pseudogymnoascus sp. VKM F-4514 (FW-929)]
MKVATELSPMVGDLSVPTPPSPDRPHLGPATRDASQVLTRVNQQVQIRPIAEAHIRFSSLGYAKADTEHTAALPQSVMYFRAPSL